MISIRETIVVEGKYDKNKLKQIVDTQVIATAGFGIFKDAEKRELLRRISETRGIIVLTDSDSAGFIIRNHLRGMLPKENVKHAYIPRVEGKERRKPKRSKEGILGVEGVEDEIIIDALRKAGATVVGENEEVKRAEPQISKTDLYQDGLCGGEKSTMLRERLIRELGFPKGMSANALVEAMNLLISKDEYDALVGKILAGE